MSLRDRSWLDRLLSKYLVTRAEHGALASKHANLLDEHAKLREQYQSWVPPGHFYSPHPDEAAISKAEHEFVTGYKQPFEIDFQEEQQLALLDTIANESKSSDFDVEDTGRRRYFYDNPAFAWSDGIVLHAMLNHLRPRRILEVGSGYSSAMMLDTIEDWPAERTTLTCVEPYPELLNSLLRPGDERRLRIVERDAQEVEVRNFTELEENDVLFIDSSHVVKASSDVNYLFFEILPRLQRGVWIQIHDIYFPFEYPPQWWREGRAWQEAYLLRAFLMYNPAFKIRWFQRYMWMRHQELLEQRVPDMANNPGGSIWIQKVADP